MRRAWVIGLVLACACACACACGCGASGGGGVPVDASAPPDAGVDAAAPDAARDAPAPGDTLPPDDAAAPDDASLTHECPTGAALCVGYASRRACVDTADGRRWRDETCGAGAGCLGGACVAGACADECDLGAVDGARTCGLYDMGADDFVAPDAAGSLHDRARAYTEWLRRDGMAAGGVGSARYADPPTYSEISYMDGIGDSAIWTGTYLAAEALRLKATGAADARAEVIRLVNTLHLWFNVSGDPGVLARFATPAGTTWPFGLGDLDCTPGTSSHCNVPYAGASYDSIGHISRDQYQGVMLGYALAYEALGEHDEATRALIRADVVALVTELMKDRQVAVKLVWNGTALPKFTVTMRFVVLCTAEMEDGAVKIVLDSNNYNNSEMFGFQEFTPDLADIVRQIPLMGWVPNIPRASSAIMLASFFRVALLATDGVPAYAAQRQAILDYYLAHGGAGGNVHDWLAVAGSYAETATCGNSYFGHNISMQPMYNLARLEDDAALRATIRNTVLAGKMWPLFRDTKNSFFAYIYAANAAAPEAGATTTAATQLGQFPPPPRVNVPVDLRADPRYEPHESGCTDQVSHTTAVDIADRPAGDFTWQRHPWGLFDWGNLAQTQPGVDYLVAYWLGRQHGFLTDDAAGRCLRWRP
ncbi:MAG TPA: hypothetical protein VGQ83_29500 [Polyangia bacterium]|jgi:hypothetical protein